MHDPLNVECHILGNVYKNAVHNVGEGDTIIVRT